MPETTQAKLPWVRQMWKIVWQHPWLLLLTIIPAIAGPALEPAKAWAAKHVLDMITKGDQSFVRSELLAFLPWIAGLFFGLGLMNFIGGLIDKMFDQRLKISLQRVYFERRCHEPGENVARTINDCEQARKVVDILQRDFWVITIGLTSVIFWQLKLAPEWIWPLLFASLPSLFVTLYIGRFAEWWSRRRLEATSGISSAVTRGDAEGLKKNQEKLYKASIRFEVFKKGSDVLAESLQWFGLLIIFLLSSVFPIIPNNITAGDIAAFLVNLKLLAKPLNEIGKTYLKYRESQPAILRVLHPAHSSTPGNDAPKPKPEPLRSGTTMEGCAGE